MPPRRRVTAPNLENGNGGRDALEDMIAVIREQVVVTALVLQHLEKNNRANGNKNGVNNGDIPGSKPQFYEVELAQPPFCRGDFNLAVAEA